MPRYAAHAKINLHLAVLAQETTGYHQIETVFCALELADEVEVTVGGEGIRLDVLGVELGPVQENTAYRAASAFFEQARLPPGARIRILKHVPAGAGLGGGSSDAAATLLALNELHGSPLGPPVLREIGFSIGSDVPFFLAALPLALAWGRGERLLALPPLASAPVLLVVPPTPTSTLEAYEALAARRNLRAASNARSPRSLRSEDFGSYERIAAIAQNDFEEIVFEQQPELGEVKRSLVDAGAIHTLLTGSGSAVFAIFRDHIALEAAAASTRSAFPHTAVLTTATCARM